MAGSRVNFGRVDIDELLPRKSQDPLTQVCREDLDPLSVAELDERIALLEGEIARVRAKLDGAVTHRSQADTLFKR